MDCLEEQRSRSRHTINNDVGQDLALRATIEFLEINLIELNKIKVDLISCLCDVDSGPELS
jgi:hypothetical protein